MFAVPRLVEVGLVPTQAEKAHLSRVASLPCCLCGSFGVNVHHILEGRVKGRKSGAFTCIPLCPDCHTGRFGVHGDKTMLKIHKITELELLGATIERLYA